MAEFFLMPAASPTMEAGRLVSWLVKEGDEIESGQFIAEVETDKATAEIESFDDGYILKIIRAAGDEVKVNSPIAIIGDDADEDISELLSSFQDAPAASEQPALADDTPKKPQPSSYKAGPAARMAAQAAGVSLESVQGTGPKGRILRSDVELHSAQTKAPDPGSVEYYRWAGKEIDQSIMEMPSFQAERSAPTRRSTNQAQSIAESVAVSNSMMRKTIARRLKESYLDAPTFFLNASFNCDKMVAFRGQIKEAGVRVSYNDLVVKAVALALKDVPAVNASWSEEAIIMHNRVDIGVAVAIPDGLITPVLRNADQKGLEILGSETRELAERARERKLQPEEYSDSTFTISNLGMMGIEHFTAIINPPNAAILAVGSMQQEAIVVNGVLTPQWRMKVTMTCDHRVIDGALGASFLAAVRRYIENPALLAC